jgi:CBS domain containing-hemolysin-like protein
MDIGLRLLAVLLLVAANGFFVAAEFALVTARKTRIAQLASQGNATALAVGRAIDDPQRFISVVQLGITAAGLALGWVGENTIAVLVESALTAVLPEAGVAGLTSHVIAIPIAFGLTTFVLVSLGELVPKMIALEKAEPVALISVRPINLVGFVFAPFIAALYWFTDVVLRMLGFRWRAEMHQAYSSEDLKLLVQSSRASGALAADPDRLVERALDFARLAAHHVMVPRTEMIAVPAHVSLEQLSEVMARHQHSRYPVFEDGPDNVIGVLSAKQLATGLARERGNGARAFDAREYASAPLFIPESMHADRLLAEMKRNRSHLAIVVDEYGATAGLVTLRDLLDRIAGEVRDEAELEPPMVEWLPDGSAMVDGLALLSDLDEELGVAFSESDYDTLGGYIFGKLGRRPVIGDSVALDGRVFEVVELDGLRVSRICMRSVESHNGPMEHSAVDPP